MLDYTGRYYSEGTTYRETRLGPPTGSPAGITLYEVIRIQQGICLFLEDHIQRLRDSITLSGHTYAIALPWLRNILAGLIRKNRLRTGNIKIAVHFTPDNPPRFLAFFIPHSYPAAALYRKGVHTALYPAIRPDPNVKRLRPEFREQVADFIHTRNLYEVLLVNEEGLITEGSKTNVFFLQGEVIFTAPGDQVLKGITRKKVYELCKQLNYKLIEEPISTDKLNKMEAAFLTGTSPKILPIRQIGDTVYRVAHPLTLSLIRAYNDLIAAYIQQQIRSW
jgi:branched-chain amino acid aminotransferase